jgi:hypothetical protein
VRGVEVPECAEVVTWSNGPTTVLPTLIRNKRNVLKHDAEYVRTVASYPAALPGSAFVTFVSRSEFEDDYKMTLAIRESIANGRPIVIRDFKSPGSFKFTEDGLRRRYGISPDMFVQLHGTSLS